MQHNMKLQTGSNYGRFVTVWIILGLCRYFQMKSLESTYTTYCETQWVLKFYTSPKQISGYAPDNVSMLELRTYNKHIQYNGHFSGLWLLTGTTTHTHLVLTTGTFFKNYSTSVYSRLDRFPKVRTLWNCFTGRMLFPSPNQQHQHTEGKQRSQLETASCHMLP